MIFKIKTNPHKDQNRSQSGQVLKAVFYVGMKHLLYAMINHPLAKDNALSQSRSNHLGLIPK